MKRSFLVPRPQRRKEQSCWPAWPLTNKAWGSPPCVFTVPSHHHPDNPGWLRPQRLRRTDGCQDTLTVLIFVFNAASYQDRTGFTKRENDGQESRVSYTNTKLFVTVNPPMFLGTQKHVLSALIKEDSE